MQKQKRKQKQQKQKTEGSQWAVRVGVPLALLLGVSTAAQATLHGRDLDGDPGTFEAVYDDTSDLTWVADANLPQSLGLGVAGIAANGRMDWDTAQLWIAALNAAGYGGQSDWRIPVTELDDATCSPGTPSTSTGICRGSELGYLFNVTFGAAGDPIYQTIAPEDEALFTNFPSGPVGYGSSEYALNTDAQWTINQTGSQSLAPKTSAYRVWPVRSGDVATPQAVPTLGPWAGLALAGLLAAAAYAVHRRLAGGATSRGA